MAHKTAVSLNIKNKKFGNHLLFKNFKLEISKGDTIAILGPSGIGKTSLLRILSGIDFEYEGEVLIDGIHPLKAKIPGVLFQEPRLLPWETSLNNIRTINKKITKKRIIELLWEVGLKGFEDSLPWQLSGGMQKRVAFARAISFDPDLFLLDEPFISLDKKLTYELIKLLIRKLTIDKTTVLVTHSLSEAVSLANKIFYLNDKPAKICNEFTIDVPREKRSDYFVFKTVQKINKVLNLEK